MLFDNKIVAIRDASIDKTSGIYKKSCEFLIDDLADRISLLNIKPGRIKVGRMGGR
jgi:hypothetical protein